MSREETTLRHRNRRVLLVLVKEDGRKYNLDKKKFDEQMTMIFVVCHRIGIEFQITYGIVQKTISVEKGPWSWRSSRLELLSCLKGSHSLPLRR